MNRVLALLTAVCLSFDVAASASGQTPASGGEQTQERCPVELTDLGRSSTWRFHYVYRVQTDDLGTVVSLRQVRGHGGAEMVNERALRDCIRGWALSPKSTYLVRYSIGTTGEPSSATITDLATRKSRPIHLGQAESE